MANVETEFIDIVGSFYVIAQASSQRDTSCELITKVMIRALILMEVPPANDFLLSTVCCDDFKQPTLRDRFMVVHTPDT